jgi:hypothetical protein
VAETIGGFGGIEWDTGGRYGRSEIRGSNFIRSGRSSLKLSFLSMRPDRTIQSRERQRVVGLTVYFGFTIDDLRFADDESIVNLI